MLKISNTLSGKVEEFHPLDEKQVRMYTCGPTVYDYAHIGNFRTFVFQDVLKRYLRFKGYQVSHVMNITDVDDKTIRNSGASNPAQLRAYTDQFTRRSSKTAASCASSAPTSLLMPPITYRRWSL